MARPKTDLSLLILSVLKTQTLHGYGIFKTIEQQSEGSLEFKGGSVYPMLKRFESEGLIEGHDVIETRTLARHYTITPKGQKEHGKQHLAFLIDIRAKIKVLQSCALNEYERSDFDQFMFEVETQLKQFDNIPPKTIALA